MRDLKSILQQCDEAIRAGQIPRAAAQLRKLNSAKIPSAQRLEAARLCRRAGLISQGLLMLAPLVRPQRKAADLQPTPSESAEYGALLLRAGAVSEALGLLDSREVATAPEAWLYLAYCHLSQWSFGPAIENLQRYIQAPLDPYAKLVGQVNLAFANVSLGRNQDAESIAQEVIVQAEKHGHARLQANALAVSARAHLQENDFARAKEDLSAAEALIGDAATMDSFFIQRWNLTLQAMETGSVKPLDKLRGRAAECGDWDAIRAADLFELKVKFDERRFYHLLFGTPFPAYREHICRELGRAPARDVFVLGPKSAPRFDLRSGTLNGNYKLSEGRANHRLMDVLLQDFYRPMSLGTMFSKLFEGEYFNPTHSPARVRQAICRARGWLEKNRVPVEIVEDEGLYSLKITGAFSFCIPFERQPLNSMSLQFAKLRAKYAPGKPFAAREARDQLKFSRATFQRLIAWGLDSGKISRMGERNDVQYKIVA